MQTYLYKYRTRMKDYGESFRGGASQVMCPLCQLHLENQVLIFQCQAIKSQNDVKGKMKDLYKENIKTETIETIMKITELRKEKMKK